MDPKFLTLEEVVFIHQDLLARYGGGQGVRDMDLLKSSVGMPPATYDGEFLHADLSEMAAAYLFHLVKNHSFVDGNKRTGAVAALVFLALNGLDFFAPEDDLADTVLAVARGEMDKGRVAAFLRAWSRPA